MMTGTAQTARQVFTSGLFCTFIFSLLSFANCVNARQVDESHIKAISEPVIVGAARMEAYLPLLHGKRVAVAGNHTSMVAGVHLVDTLLKRDVDVVKVFSPEHGFRGTAAAGEWVEGGIDPETGLPVVSLYGSNRRPTPGQLQDVDIILFDIQDVGLRYYTYISTMTYLMEEAARHLIHVIVLDRPNPLGHLIDGPLLDPKHASFVGLHAVPIAHGMTVGEYALMVNGELWLSGGITCRLTVVEMENYWKSRPYPLPLPPSPNLPNMYAVYLYPDLCFFEGTVISVGRGTSKPFQVFGHPALNPKDYTYSFVPASVTAAPNPPHLGKLCHGKDLTVLSLDSLSKQDRINLEYLLQAYRDYDNKTAFFNAFFEKLSGTDALRDQIIAGLSEEQIRATWQTGLSQFRETRKKYLLYPDEK